MQKFALVTACTDDYILKLKWCLPTWKTKPQFADAHLYIFAKVKCKPCLRWVYEFFPNTTIIDWSMPQAENQREEMLSAFVLGVAKHVQEEHVVKLDADTYFTDSCDVFEPDDFNYDLVAHKWSYTKPAWWVDKMTAWVDGKEWTGEKRGGSYGHRRIISWCCLHRTEFVRLCAEASLRRGDRLPIPSHDSYLWFMADYFPDAKWKSKNVKSLGVNHCSKWRKIREDVCARNPWNQYLQRELMKNVQLEITTACNMACPNCDRNCGTAPSGERMSVEQVRKFVTESENHEWSRIDIIGGEPTTHPELFEILDEIKTYKQAHPGCKIRLTTNGTSAQVQRGILDEIGTRYPFVHIRNSAKESGPQVAFDLVNVAPCDRGVSSALGCSIPWRCGLGLNRYGFHFCGSGASIARVFGLDLAYKSLGECIDFRAQQQQLCRLCGHSRSIAKTGREQETSRAWRSAFKHYRRNAENLSLY